jgi:hypothetical protein
LRGDPPRRPCHLCRGAHWARDCHLFGDWERRREERRVLREGGEGGGA